jgi:hypothetical protein
VSNAWGQKKHLATDFEFPGTEMFDNPEILYRSFLPQRIIKMFNGQSKFFHSRFWLEVSRDFGQFIRRLRGDLRVKFEGFAGSLKVPGILGSFIAAVHCSTREEGKSSHQNPMEAGLVETQTARAKSPKNSSYFRESSKKSFLGKSRFPLPENLPFEPSWVVRDCSIHPLEKIPNPRNDSSIFHSSPVQEQSNPQNSPKPTENQCFSKGAHQEENFH